MPPAPASSLRRIIHVDMDAFYASVEQRDNPDLRGRPVAVGGARARGVVAAASYEARAFGVRSAMPSVTARRHCPDLVFVPPRFDVYRAVSAHIHAIFARYTPLIQPLSLDEAYLDVTAPLIEAGSATAIAALIRADIRRETGLTASAGVSYNKLLAKLASGYRKPDGLFVITPRIGPDFVASLPIGRFHGIGPVTASRMNLLGILTGADLRTWTQEALCAQFGKAGAYYYGIARAQDDRPVEPDRERKSIGAETTFPHDLRQWDDVPAAVAPLIAKVWAVYARDGLVARTLTVKVKDADFKIASRSRTFETAIAALPLVEESCFALLRPFFPSDRGVRLLGVGLSNLAVHGGDAVRQLALKLG